MEIVFVRRDTAEWLYMWLWLELHSINEGLEEPLVALHEGEVWQYMCSYKNDNKIVHEFRHRNHPKTNAPYTASLSASDTFNDDQMEKSVKII